MSILSKRIKSLRNSKSLTQSELGKILGVGKTTISMYENDNSTPNDEIKLKIAEYFDVSLDYLLGKTDAINNTAEFTKKDVKDHNNFMEDAKALFMNGEVAEEDKEKIFKDISDLFWESKKINKEKYGRKKEK